MAMKAYQFVGLSNPVYLPDDITVEIAIVPASMSNVRSNQKRGAAEVTTYTQHETANFATGANADMHKRWLHNGAGGAYVGFNFVVDDRKIIQLTPLDEVTWAAGTPAGNRTSDHTELCVNADINHERARRNAAALAAGVLKARGLPVSALVQHNVWYGKDCPLLMRQNGSAIWNTTFVPTVGEFYNMAAQANAPKPVGKRTFTIRFDLLGRYAPGFWDKDKNQGTVIKTADGQDYILKAGTTGTVKEGPKVVDGIEWYDIDVPGKGSFWVQDQVLHTLDIKAA